MQFLPTIIIASLLVFFLTLTLILTLWHWRRSRLLRRKRHSNNSYKKNPTRHLTIEGGKVVDIVDALEKAGISDEKLEALPYPVVEVSLAEPKQRGSDQSTILSRTRETPASSRNAIYGMPPQPIDVPARPKSARKNSWRLSSYQQHEAQPLFLPPGFALPQAFLARSGSGSFALPRPELINIERKGSNQSSKKAKARRVSYPTGRTARPWYGRTNSGRAVVHELPGSPLAAEASNGWSDTRRASQRRPSAATISTPTKTKRRASAPTPGPTPLSSSDSSDPSQHVTFAIQETVRSAFSSTSESPDSSSDSKAQSTSSAVRAPSASMTAPPDHVPPSQVSPVAGESNSPPRMIARLDCPPGLDVDAPQTGNLALSPSPRTSPNIPDSPQVFTTPLSSPNLPDFSPVTSPNRGASVRSNRSVLTIASSEISSNFTVSEAQAVNIFPSVTQEGEGEGEASESADRDTHSYARTLRSKYGRFPRGRRDKALPTLPKSPLSMSFGHG